MLNKELNEFGRKTDDFMEPSFVANKIIEYLENPGDEWHIILRRPK